MKKKTRKKKIALSVISVTLVFATVVSLVPAALASTARSLDYIETLKENYTGGALKVLEIAPTDTDGVMGYYAEGSEPSNDWVQKVAMYSTPTARENFARDEFKKLIDLGVLSETGDAAPLHLEKPYNEFYPWEVSEKDRESLKYLKLDGLESLDVPGTMNFVGTNKGEYTVSSEYVPAVSAYKNYFNFGEWRSTLEKTLRETLGADFETKKFESSKILVPNKNDKTVTVFGSTEENWKYFTEMNSGSLFYDLSKAYADTDYYTIPVDSVNGGTYILSFDVIASDGKGQFTVLPLTADGKNISYSPNYSKQYWYRNEYVSSGHYEYQFTVPKNSGAAKIQVRFDVDNLKASAIFSNVTIYKFTNNLFEVEKYVGTGDAITADSRKITAKAASSVPEVYSGANNKDGNYYVECGENTVCNLTYHTEIAPGGGKSKVIIRGYDAGGNLISDVIATEVKEKSGTYSVNFNSGNAKYLAITFTVDASGITEEQTVVYSNISVTALANYETESVEANYIQVIPYLEIGDSGYEFDESIFNFQSWHSSGSYGRGEGSDLSSAVFATESKSIITVTGRGETVTRDTYKGSDNIYYMPVTEGDVYRLTYDVESSITGGGEAKIENAIKLVYCNENKNKISEETVIKRADSAGISTYTYEFTVGSGCKWLQIGFGNTESNQKNSFYNISLCRKNRPKAFYYDAIFTKIEGTELSGEEAIYEPQYKFLGKADGFVFEEGKTYYFYDRDKSYKKVEDPTKLEPSSEIYERTGLYEFIGYANEISLQVGGEYYTGQINYSGYADVRDTSALGTGSVYYLRDESGNYVYGGTVDENTVFDPAVTYYVQITTVSESYDVNHPYWVASDMFIEAGEDTEGTPLFRRIDNGYTFVGKDSTGNYLGDYEFHYDKDGSDTVRMTTDEVYYEGGYVNNNWFKRYVLNCNEEQMDNVGVSVTTVTPEYLNNLDEEEIVLFLQGFELFVFSYGGLDGNAEFSSDISEATANAILAELNDTMGEGDYPIPRAIDLRVIDNGPAKLSSLCSELCAGITSLTGGVSEFTYMFYRFFDVKSFANDKFVLSFDNSYFDSSDDAYYDVIQELIYENYIINVNGNKYDSFDLLVSEANCFRYILNFRGQRIRKFKDTIRILEIQPYTNKSDLLDSSGKHISNQLRDWFSSTGDDLLYVDENGNKRNVNIIVTTMAAGELAAKNESIIENYDMIYIGASLDGIKEISNTETGQKFDESGHAIPDYNDDRMDGMYYTNTGDTYITSGAGELDRANLAGLVGSDYTVIGKDNDSGWAFIRNGVWVVDASPCTLRKSGNDITENIANQISDFAAAGKPIVYSDELIENEFVGKFSAEVTGTIEKWGEYEDSYRPYISLVADLKMPDGQVLPEGVEPYFTWHSTNGGTKLTTFSENGGSIYRADVDGDGIKEGIYKFYLNANEENRRTGDYYVTVSFRFSGKKYKGLKDLSFDSSYCNIYDKDIYYKVSFSTKAPSAFGKADDVMAVFELDTPISEGGFMPSAGSGYPYGFEWRSSSWSSANWNGVDYLGATEYYVYEGNTYIGSDWQHPTPNTTKIAVRQHFTEGRNAFQFRVYVGANQADREDPTLVTYLNKGARVINTPKENTRDFVRYYMFKTSKAAETYDSKSGIALNEERFDSSSYMYDCMNKVFNSEGQVRTNVFSAAQLTEDKSAGDYRYKLVKYANLSAPEIIVNDGSKDYEEFMNTYKLGDDLKNVPSYPDELPNNSRILEFEFAIQNNTDETPLKTKYDYEFYVDNNADGKFSENEKTNASVIGVKTASVNGGLTACTASKAYVYKLTKVFPQSVSGIIPWKLVITKIGDDKTHISHVDYAYVQPSEMAVVRALQILPNDFKSTYRQRENKFDEFGIVIPESSLDGDLYTGSVFLSDIFLEDSVRKIREDNGKDVMLDRVIIYPDMMPDTEHAADIYSRDYWINQGNDKETGKPILNGKQRQSGIDHWQYPDASYHPQRVLFFVGEDFILDIAFTCIDDLNGGMVQAAINENFDDSQAQQGAEAEGKVYSTLTSYDMLILGFGDNWGKHGSRYGDGLNTIKAFGLETLTYCGFQQGTALAIEEFIDSGRPVLFCHDTASMSNNFINYAVNEAWNAITEKLRDFGDKIKRWWADLWGNEDPVDPDKVVTLHTSRVKQGYFNNVATRDSLGLDRYGITKNIKDKLMTNEGKPNHYQIVFDDENLKAAYNYTIIYDDTSQYDSPGELDLTKLSAADRGRIENKIQSYVESGYAIAYVPTKGAENAKTRIDCFAQGYSDFIIDRNEDGLGDIRDSETITQVNSGQITSYPYDVNIAEIIKEGENTKTYGTMEIKPTHEQVYQVSLNTDSNGDGTTVWYCYDSASSSNKNWSTYRNNAMNAYYIYTRKNVTYTGAGHTNVFSEAEAKLFLNTIVASYRAGSDKPVMNFVKENGIDTERYKVLVSSAKETDSGETQVEIENDKIYFKINDVAIDSDLEKKLSVNFYLDSEKTKEITGITAYEVGASSASSLNNLRMNTVYYFELPESLITELKKDSVNELTVYAQATLEYTMETTITQKSDTVDITVRKLGLHSIV